MTTRDKLVCTIQIFCVIPGLALLFYSIVDNDTFLAKIGIVLFVLYFLIGCVYWGIWY